MRLPSWSKSARSRGRFVGSACAKASCEGRRDGRGAPAARARAPGADAEPCGEALPREEARFFLARADEARQVAVVHLVERVDERLPREDERHDQELLDELGLRISIT